MAKWSSPLPTGCRLTSNFGSRWGTLHAGTDYAPPKPGQKNIPVYAVADGIILRTGRGNGLRNAHGVPYHSGIYAYQDIGVHGGDHMRIYYGHLASLAVKPGQFVRAGQLIGIMGGSGAKGANDFAIHLHLGVSQNSNRPIRAARWAGDPGWINPLVWLRSKGITVGSTTPVVASTPNKPKPPTASKHVRSIESIANILTLAGYMYGKPTLGLGIERYQHQQVKPFTLVHDRVWGAVTERHYKWVTSLQIAMNQWAGEKLQVDGDYRAKTHARVREIQQRNHGGAYKGAVDGIAGPMFCRMLGISTHP